MSTFNQDIESILYTLCGHSITIRYQTEDNFSRIYKIPGQFFVLVCSQQRACLIVQTVGTRARLDTSRAILLDQI